MADHISIVRTLSVRERTEVLRERTFSVLGRVSTSVRNSFNELRRSSNQISVHSPIDAETRLSISTRRPRRVRSGLHPDAGHSEKSGEKGGKSGKGEQGQDEDGVSTLDYVSAVYSRRSRPDSPSIYSNEEEGDDVRARLHSLSWPRLTMCLAVEAVGLGCLGLPAAYATLGMVPALLVTAFLGILSMWCGVLVGEASLLHAGVRDFARLGFLVAGKAGAVFTGLWLILDLGFGTSGKMLTGVLALEEISGGKSCKIIYGLVSLLVCTLLALPTSFSDIAFLGYVDCVSIMSAVILTIAAAGHDAAARPGGFSAGTWVAFRTENPPSLAEAMLAVSNICYCFGAAQCIPTMMAQLSKPREYKKAVITLGTFMLVLYTFIGAVTYYFIGEGVRSPALLSNSPLVSKISFGLALPVIFISGAINTTCACQFLHDKICGDGDNRLDKAERSRMCYVIWVSLVVGLSLVAWVTAVSVPSFSGMLGLIAALTISFFSFTAPAIIWFKLLKDERPWYVGSNLWNALFHGAVVLVGLFIMGAGTWASALELIHTWSNGKLWVC